MNPSPHHIERRGLAMMGRLAIRASCFMSSTSMMLFRLTI
jgi:hypothetical protein